MKNFTEIIKKNLGIIILCFFEAFAGVLLFINPASFTASIIIGIGIIILVTGLIKIQWAVDLFRMKIQKWFFAAIGAALSLLFAFIILKNPFGSTVFLWRFVAVSLVLEAVLDIATLFFNYNGRQKTDETMLNQIDD